MQDNCRLAPHHHRHPQQLGRDLLFPPTTATGVTDSAEAATTHGTCQEKQKLYPPPPPNPRIVPIDVKRSNWCPFGK